MEKRERDQQIKFWATNEEKEKIISRMDALGIKNMSAYLRKMALDGYIINIDVPELKKIISLLRYAGNNINQIAMKVNASGVIYPKEIKEIEQFQAELWKLLNKIIAEFAGVR